MAIRRPLGIDREFGDLESEDATFPGNTRDLFGGDPHVDEGSGNDPFGIGLPNYDFTDPNVIDELQRGAISGNLETAREIGIGGFTRPAQYGAPRQQPASDAPALPHGVTVNNQEGVPAPSTQFADVPPASNSMQTALSPMSPEPVAMQGQPASMAPNESGTGPQRVSLTPAQSVLFGGESNPSRSGLFGGLGGLTEGGIGVPGASPGGPSPTQMMLQLARMLRQGQGV